MSTFDKVADIISETSEIPREEITPEREKELFNKIKDRYDEQISPYYAASRLWVDAIIDPIETRKIISMGIEMANNKPINDFNTGTTLNSFFFWIQNSREERNYF